MRSIHFRAGTALVACLLLSGCVTLGSDIPLLSNTGLDSAPADEKADSPAPATVPPGTPKQFSEFELAPAASAGELRFQSGDSIKVSVWGYSELDHIATVQPNGNITLPLVGEVLAVGLTVRELRQNITGLLQPFTKVAVSDLRPGDSLALEVWQRSELSKTVPIAPDGSVTLPLVGRVMAAGRPVEDIRKEVEERMLVFLRDARVTLLPTLMNRRVLYDTQVSVLAAQIQPRRAAVIGEVVSQGIIEFKGSLRLSEALAQSQMMEKTAELNSIIVIRNRESSTPQYRRIRLADFIAGRAPDQNIYLQNDDIVIVPKTTIARVGDFVEQFFSRTALVFYWWMAGWQASSAQATSDTTKLINESLRRNLLSITPAPP